MLEFVARLQQTPELVDAGGAVDLIGALETLKCVSAAVQATATDAVATITASERKAAGRPKSKWRTGIASQIGLARRESPNKGGRFLGLARALVHEMPHTHARLLAGDLNEWRASLIARETACLTVEDRQAIDEHMCSDPSTLKYKGDKAIEAKARALAAEIDAAAVVKKKAKAFRERRSSSRPLPDFMGEFTTLTSMDRVVSMWATLRRDADSIAGVGDESRTRDQIMADLAYERITGASSARAGAPVAVNLVMSDETLFGAGSKSAYLEGYGEIPARIARHMVRESCEDSETIDGPVLSTLRRLYADPDTGALTAMESKSRHFPTGLARLIDVRDRSCRTPWCDAPIRHRDHIRSYARGGKTSAHNGAGLCAACNHAKEADGWKSEPRPKKMGVLHIYDFETPTGHDYTSEAPYVPVARRYPSFVEEDLLFDLVPSYLSA